MAVDAKNITRLDIPDIFDEVKSITHEMVSSAGDDISIDKFAINDNEISHSKIVYRLAMKGMAQVADKARMVKVHNQSAIDALTYYDQHEDPADNEDSDGNITDPDGNKFDPDTFIINDKSETGEKLDPTTGDTIEFSIEGLTGLVRYTVVQEFIKDAIVQFVLWKWWNMKKNKAHPEIVVWAADAEKDFKAAVRSVRHNSVVGHRNRKTKLKYRNLG